MSTKFPTIPTPPHKRDLTQRFSLVSQVDVCQSSWGEVLKQSLERLDPPPQSVSKLKTSLQSILFFFFWYLIHISYTSILKAS